MAYVRFSVDGVITHAEVDDQFLPDPVTAETANLGGGMTELTMHLAQDFPGNNVSIVAISEVPFRTAPQSQSLSDEKESAYDAIESAHDALIHQLVERPSAVQRDTWQLKLKQSQRFLELDANSSRSSDEEAEYTHLTALLSQVLTSAEQSAGGISDYANLVLQKNEHVEHVVAAADGMRRKAMEQVDTASSKEQVETVTDGVGASVAQIVSDLTQE